MRNCMTQHRSVIKAFACYNGSPACQPKCKLDGNVTMCRWDCRETFEYVGKVVDRMNE